MDRRFSLVAAASIGTELAIDAGVVAEDLDRTDSGEGLDLDRTSVRKEDIRDMFAQELRRDLVMEIRCVKEELMDCSFLPVRERNHTHPHSARDLRRAERSRGGRRGR